MKIEKILVPTDFSRPAARSLAVAVELASVWQASLKLVYAMEPLVVAAPEGIVVDGFAVDRMMRQINHALEEQQAEAMRLGSTQVTTRRLDGTPWRAIVEEARRGGYDLIVLGTHGRTGLSHAILGSVAERVVQHAPCPVLVTRDKEAAAQHQAA